MQIGGVVGELVYIAWENWPDVSREAFDLLPNQQEWLAPLQKEGWMANAPPHLFYHLRIARGVTADILAYWLQNPAWLNIMGRFDPLSGIITVDIVSAIVPAARSTFVSQPETHLTPASEETRPMGRHRSTQSQKRFKSSA